MNKKSHIDLAVFLARDSRMKGRIHYKKSFYMGSILPDCQPSFVYQQHTFHSTFLILKEAILSITDQYDFKKGITRFYCRQLGVIAHYLADYFTYAHNTCYKGSMKEHISYEKELIPALNTYIQKVGEKSSIENPLECKSAEEICNYIIKMYKLYQKSIHTMKNDCGYIFEICYKVIGAILQLSDNCWQSNKEELLLTSQFNEHIMVELITNKYTNYIYF